MSSSPELPGWPWKGNNLCSPCTPQHTERSMLANSWVKEAIAMLLHMIAYKHGPAEPLTAEPDAIMAGAQATPSWPQAAGFP